MKLTKSQKEDIELSKYFMVGNIKDIPVTDADIKKYLEWSEQGKHRLDVKQSHFSDGFNALVTGKQWRGRTMEMWENSIMEFMGIGYFTLLGGEKRADVLPRIVVDFMKKEMFKGIDADLIESNYQDILWQWTPWYKKIWRRVRGTHHKSKNWWNQ